MDKAIEEICSEFARLPDEASRKSLISRSPQLVNQQVVVQLDEAVRESVRIDVRKALGQAEIALAIAEQLGEDEALALASRSKANALWFMGDCKSAIELFRTAGHLFERAGNRNEVARTLSSSIQLLSIIWRAAL